MAEKIINRAIQTLYMPKKQRFIYQKNKIIVEVSPSPGDAGSSIGSAIFAALINNFNIDRYFNQLDPFLGPLAPLGLRV